MKNKRVHCPKCNDLLEVGIFFCDKCKEKVRKPYWILPWRQRWRKRADEAEILLGIESRIHWRSLVLGIITIILIGIALTKPWWIEENGGKTKYYLTESQTDSITIQYDVFESAENRLTVFHVTHTACIIAIIFVIITMIYMLIKNFNGLTKFQAIAKVLFVLSLFIVGFIPIFFYIGINEAIEADVIEFEKEIKEETGLDVEIEEPENTQVSTGFLLSIMALLVFLCAYLDYMITEKKIKTSPSKGISDKLFTQLTKGLECSECDWVGLEFESDGTCPNCGTSLIIKIFGIENVTLTSRLNKGVIALLLIILLPLLFFSIYKDDHLTIILSIIAIIVASVFIFKKKQL